MVGIRRAQGQSRPHTSIYGRPNSLDNRTCGLLVVPINSKMPNSHSWFAKCLRCKYTLILAQYTFHWAEPACQDSSRPTPDACALNSRVHSEQIANIILSLSLMQTHSVPCYLRQIELCYKKRKSLYKKSDLRDELSDLPTLIRTAYVTLAQDVNHRIFFQF